MAGRPNTITYLQALVSLSLISLIATGAGCKTANTPGHLGDQTGYLDHGYIEFERVAEGFNHSCGITSQGRVFCWGESDFGQAHPPDDRFAEIAVGGAHTCGITVSGQLKCWGLDQETEKEVEQAARGMKWGYPTENGLADPPSGRFVDVSAGWSHNCAITKSRELRCWGSNREGESTPPEGNYVDVSVATNSGCAVTESGVMQCWGERQLSAKPARLEGRYRRVAMSPTTICGMNESQQIECWHVGFEDRNKVVVQTEKYRAMSAGEWHGCGVRKESGEVTCWNTARSGGVEAYEQPGGFQPVSGTFLHISSANVWDCGVRTNGTIECWVTGSMSY